MENEQAHWPFHHVQDKDASFNWIMWSKIVFWIGLWAGTYYLIVFSDFSGSSKFLLAFFHILTHPFIALNIGHDANHNAITQNRYLRPLLKRSFDLIGISSWCWRLNHNRLHHPYTSVLGIDTTTDGKKVLRLNKEEPRYFFHRFQFLYAPLAYGLVTLNYVFHRDFRDFFHLLRKAERKRFILPFLECLLFKFLYLLIMLIIPIKVLPYSAVSIIGTFLLAHFFLGQIIILIQVPHFNLKTIPVSESDLPKNREEELNFILKHTADMAPTSRFWNWLLGGTNHHVIHHLYPAVCHTQYCQMTEILMKYCGERELQYNYYESVTASYLSHYGYLKQMGRGND